jgi:hypothetical protein
MEQKLSSIMTDCKSSLSLPPTSSDIFSKAILDAQLTFKMRHRSLITYGFAVKDKLRKWPKLVLPQSEDSAQMVAELETEKISVYFAIQDESQISRDRIG